MFGHSRGPRSRLDECTDGSIGCNEQDVPTKISRLGCPIPRASQITASAGAGVNEYRSKQSTPARDTGKIFHT